MSAISINIFSAQPRPSDILRDPRTGEFMIIYLPTYASEFRQGHERGYWYFREVSRIGGPPVSCGYDTAEEARAAVLGE